MPPTIDDAIPAVDAPTLGARVGYAGKALLYVSLAILITQMSLGRPSGEASAQGAFAVIARQPLGPVLLLALAIGLLAHGGHSAWNAFDEDRDGLERWSGIGRGVVYLGLGALAVAQAFGPSSSGGSSETTSLTATVLNWPGGTWLVAAVGIGIVAVGVRLLVRAVTANWHDEFERHRMSAAEHTAIRRTGQAGHVARAIAYGLVGGFVTYAALTHDPDKGGGLDKALGEVTRTSFAPFVLVPLAVGMLAYAVFAAMMARYADG